MDAVADVHDQRHVVVDQQHARAVLVADRADDRGERPGTSASGSPAAGSSSSTKRGSVASARATPSRRSSPCASVAGRRVRVRASSPSTLEQLVGARAAPRAAARADAERRDLDVLAHGQPAERVAVLERPREPVPAAPVRRPARDVAALELDGARRRPVEAAEHVDERRLAGAVRADQPDDLAAAQLERDVARAPATPSNERETAEARSVPPGLLSCSRSLRSAKRR